MTEEEIKQARELECDQYVCPDCACGREAVLGLLVERDQLKAQLTHQHKRAEAWREAALEMLQCAEYLWNLDQIEYHCDDEDCPGDDTCSCNEPDAVNRLLGSCGSALDRARAIEGDE